jgi:hypothetical protein
VGMGAGDESGKKRLWVVRVRERNWILWNMDASLGLEGLSYAEFFLSRVIYGLF